MLGRDKFPFQPRIFFFFRPRTYPFNSRKTYCNRSNRPSLSCRTKFQTSLSLLFSHRSWKMPRHFAKTAHGRKVVPTFLGWTSQVFPRRIFAILRFFIYPLLNPFSGLGFVSDLCSLLTLPAFFASFFAFFDSFCDRSFEGTALTPTMHGSEVNLHLCQESDWQNLQCNYFAGCSWSKQFLSLSSAPARVLKHECPTWWPRDLQDLHSI